MLFGIQRNSMALLACLLAGSCYQRCRSTNHGAPRRGAAAAEGNTATCTLPRPAILRFVAMISTFSHPSLRLCSPSCRQLGGAPRPCPSLRRIDAMSITSSAELEQATARRVQELEARVAELHLKAQALNKQSGREAEATAIYKELAALDDEALELTLSGAQPPTAATIAAVASAFPAFYTPLLPPCWGSAEHRRRALGAVLGSAMGDAAACSCQWVYSEPAMATLAVAAAERKLGRVH